MDSPALIMSTIVPHILSHIGPKDYTYLKWNFTPTLSHLIRKYICPLSIPDHPVYLLARDGFKGKYNGDSA